MSELSGSNGVGGGGLSGAEALELSAQLAGLARAGLPMASGLAALAEELPRGRLRRSMKELAARLESGMSLTEAIEDQKGRIPPHLRGLVIAGARSHRLGDVLGEFSVFASIGVELRRRLWLSLAYPVLTLLLTLSVFAFVGIILIPQFESIFRDFGVPLPGVTLAILGLADRHGRPSGRTLAVLAGLAGRRLRLGAYLFLPTATLRGLAGRVPLVGGVWRWTSLSEFCHLLALLLEHRLPMPEALRLSGDAVQDSGLQSATHHMAADVEDGKTLARAMAECRPFPPRLPRLLQWGEKRGGLPEVLHMAGEMFAARASAHSTFAGTALSVACFVLILLGVNLIVLGLMLPMISLINRLSG